MRSSPHLLYLHEKDAPVLHAPKLCLACGLSLWLFAAPAAQAQENLPNPDH